MTWRNDDNTAAGHQRSDWFLLLLRTIYPGLAKVEHVEDYKRQTNGVDLILTMQNGFCASWEIKFRKKERDDVALEYSHKHDDGSVRPGWIERNMWASFFAYCFVPSRTVLLMRSSKLQMAWMLNRWVWRETFYSVESSTNNVDYKTISVAVPIKELKKHLPIKKFTVAETP